TKMSLLKYSFVSINGEKRPAGRFVLKRELLYNKALQRHLNGYPS
ncbi:L-idonate 5-dehydrogenase, partial [Salmonella enterica]|nr:L-idonate 5-dehydrogenase [Salmonella enterica]